MFIYFGYGIWNSGLETPNGRSQETYEGTDLDYTDIEKQNVGYQVRQQNISGITVHEHMAKAEAILKKQDDAEQLITDSSEEYDEDGRE